LKRTLISFSLKTCSCDLDEVIARTDFLGSLKSNSQRGTYGREKALLHVLHRCGFLFVSVDPNFHQLSSAFIKKRDGLGVLRERQCRARWSMREKLFLHTLHTKGFGLRVSLLLDGIIELRSGSLGSCPSVVGKGSALLSSTIVSTMVSSCGASVIWSTDMTPDQDGIVVIWSNN
jgi:hypothetical protein